MDKVIRDQVHGDMRFNATLVTAINNPLFQRLRFIFQNGLTHLVYPGMSNNRFQHSLGVSHLAGQWFDSIVKSEISKKSDFKESKFDAGKFDFNRTQNTYEQIRGNESYWKNIIMLAGLLHDVGHAPYSHTFEKAGVFHPKEFTESELAQSIWAKDGSLKKYLQKKYVKEVYEENDHVEHEDISLLLISEIVNSIEINCSSFGVDETEVKLNSALFVCCLVSEDYLNKVAETEIVVSKYLDILSLLKMMISGYVDVDRLDYIQRDTSHAGVKYGHIEANRIISNLLPVFLFDVDDKKTVGFLLKEREVQVMDHFFISLVLCYAQVMYHPKVVQFDFEFCQILRAYFDANFNEKGKDVLNYFLSETDSSLISKMNIFIDKHSSVNPLKKIFSRSYKEESGLKCIYSLPKDLNKPDELNSYVRLKDKERSILKEDNVIILYSHIRGKYHLSSWESNSMVANHLKSYVFTTRVFYSNTAFENDLKKMKASFPKVENSSSPEKENEASKEIKAS